MKRAESYLLPTIKVGVSRKSGKGLFSTQAIEKGRIIIDYENGIGKFVDGKIANELYKQGLDHMIQVDDDLFFAATSEGEFEDADLVNHSCDPNCGIMGKLKIVAMKDIKIGEEITIDYAMMESSSYSFQCNCGSEICRGTITGEDWKIPKLQNKYKGYFSDYLSKKILKQKSSSTSF